MTLVATDSSTSTLAQTDPRVKDQAQKFVLTLSCVERAGIVQAVTTFLFERGFNIDEHQQFDDGLRETLHLRTAFSGSPEYTPERLQEEFSAIADRFEMKFSFHDQTKQRILVMVSKFGHCQNDLLFRWRGGTLGGDIDLIVSNPETHRTMAAAAGLPFH
jgi:formyltetrahydrofolate deformylase